MKRIFALGFAIFMASSAVAFADAPGCLGGVSNSDLVSELSRRLGAGGGAGGGAGNQCTCTTNRTGQGWGYVAYKRGVRTVSNLFDSSSEADAQSACQQAIIAAPNCFN